MRKKIKKVKFIAFSFDTRVLKMTTHGPTRWQVLILLDSSTWEIIVANAASAVEFCNKDLVEASSKLRVKSVHKVWDSIIMSTNFIASAADKQWLKRNAGLSETTEIEFHLSQFKFFWRF